MQDLINGALENQSVLIGHHAWFAPLLALLAGMLTSLTPCSLSSIPLVIAYVGGAGRSNPKIAFRFSLVFALGMAITFTLLGTVASLVGKLLNIGAAPWGYLVLGLLMIAMAFQTWGLIAIIPASYTQTLNKKRGYVGALFTGILGGLFSSPCATPVLIALLALVAREANPLWVTLLLLFYFLGHGLLAIEATTFIGFTGSLTKSSRYGYFAQRVNILLGTCILAAGFYLLYFGF